MDLVGLIREVAPALGDAGDGFHGADTPPRRRAWTGGGAGRLELLLDAASQLRGLLPMIDPNVSTKLDDRSGQFAAVRHELDRVVEEQLAAPGIARLPAIHAGVLQPIPLETTGPSRRPVLPTLRSAHGGTRGGRRSRPTDILVGGWLRDGGCGLHLTQPQAERRRQPDGARRAPGPSGVAPVFGQLASPAVRAVVGVGEGKTATVQRLIRRQAAVPEC